MPLFDWYYYMSSNKLLTVVSFLVLMFGTVKMLRTMQPAKVASRGLQLRMASVLNIYSKELKEILGDNGKRSQFQIVDVREADELIVASLPDKDVIHLPLSKSDVWAEEIIEGTSALKSDKSTICVCHHGMRSKRMADFLGNSLLFILSGHIMTGTLSSNLFSISSEVFERL